MHLPEDVIVDLLPAYFAGDASPASRAIVDAYFAAHPAFADAMRASQGAGDAVPDIAPNDRGHEAVRRVRKKVRQRSLLMALAIFCSMAPLTFVARDGQLAYLMLRDAPVTALCYAIVAAIAWLALWTRNPAAVA